MLFLILIILLHTQWSKVIRDNAILPLTDEKPRQPSNVSGSITASSAASN